ncbi:TetR/AcrR family transcriptional regulator [Fodinibius sediminis]|uniref:Transcriptional regulator, TetR family n=1 Tax=Fodinibius sediminis TaxID=1214077 RepID=A0A521DGW5_9BACT|nr:TetR/AcrR family transcriptional regulator [Fodinibius sediminis]SMO70959.1 transcriptional regulator, TetR family [Fodinibius sediminis]
MSTLDPETLEIKYAIADAAVDLYLKGNGYFVIKDVAKATGIDPADVFDYFPNKEAILQFYYTAIIYRYRFMIDEISGFEAYSISEKFSNFAYASFDMLDEKPAFVDNTFEQLILQSHTTTDFEQEVEKLLKEFLEEDSRLSTGSTIIMNSCFYAFLRRKYLETIRFRIYDTSEGHELTMEFIDKLTSLLQELLYNTILDQGFELGKFLYSNKKTFLNQMPLIKKIFSKIEIR